MEPLAFLRALSAAIRRDMLASLGDSKDALTRPEFKAPISKLRRLLATWPAGGARTTTLADLTLLETRYVGSTRDALLSTGDKMDEALSSDAEDPAPALGRCVWALIGLKISDESPYPRVRSYGRSRYLPLVEGSLTEARERGASTTELDALKARLEALR